MKNFKLTLMALLVGFVFFGLNSCNQTSEPSTATTFDSPEWMVEYPDASAGDIIGGTLDQPFGLCDEANDVRMMNGDDRRGGDDRMTDKRKFMPLARVLRQLGLDDAQKELLQGFMFDYRICIRESVMDLREAEQALMAPFNERRREIFAAYKNGDITREEAMLQLQTLREEIKAALEENDFRLQACEAMKECQKAFFESIRSMLTEEQQVIWDEWVANLPDRPCERPTDRG